MFGNDSFIKEVGEDYTYLGINGIHKIKEPSTLWAVTELDYGPISPLIDFLLSRNCLPRPYKIREESILNPINVIRIFPLPMYMRK